MTQDLMSLWVVLSFHHLIYYLDNIIRSVSLIFNGYPGIRAFLLRTFELDPDVSYSIFLWCCRVHDQFPLRLTKHTPA